MKYKNILDDVLAGKFVRDIDVRKWFRMKRDGTFEDEDGNFYKGIVRAEYDSDTWEVKQDYSADGETRTVKLSQSQMLPKPPKPTLLQAIEQKKIVPGDKIKFNPGDTFTMDQEGRLINPLGMPLTFNIDDFLREDFEIIKPVPEVLTKEEYWNKYFYDGFVHDDYEHYVKTAFRKGTDNGQLKEQLRTHKLLCAIQHLSNNCDHDGLSTLTKNVLDEFENLKPLNEE